MVQSRKVLLPNPITINDKKINPVPLLIIALFTFIVFLRPSFVLGSTANNGILYYGAGCPHCAKVEAFIEKNGPKDKIIEKEIYHHPDNAKEFNRICNQKGISLINRGVPFLYVNDQCFIGDQQIIDHFKQSQSMRRGIAKNPKSNETNNNKLTIPLVIGAAAIDAINPCAFAVLLVLMMTILATGNRRKALLAGLSFSASIFISYFLMGLGLYSIVAGFRASQIFIKGVGVAAMLLGLLNIKDFFWYGKGVLIEVPMKWRPQMKRIINQATGPVGAFLIGFLISLFLLPCTSGPYILIVSMLGNKTTHSSAVKLLLLYNLIFVLPMIFISFGTCWGMDIQKAETKRSRHLRTLHLIAGAILIIMGTYLVI